MVKVLLTRLKVLGSNHILLPDVFKKKKKKNHLLIFLATSFFVRVYSKYFNLCVVWMHFFYFKILVTVMNFNRLLNEFFSHIHYLLLMG